jgi:hypothetical protein
MPDGFTAIHETCLAAFFGYVALGILENTCADRRFRIVTVHIFQDWTRTNAIS